MTSTTVTERKVAGRLPLICPPRFVGRERELAALAKALAAPPAVVLVEGEAGIGKSRLVQEFLAFQAKPRQRVLVACCPPLRTPCTLGAVTDGLRQAVPDGIRGFGLSGLAGALRPLFPEWADDLPAAPELLEDATAARYRVFAALAELLDGLNLGLLVVEDVHWADEATLEFLLFLAARQPQQVSLLVTYRPEDVPASSLLWRLSARLPAGTTRARVTLEPLGIPETVALVSSMLEAAPVSEKFAAFLCDHADGLPLAIEESVRLLADRADLIRRGGEWVRRRDLDRIAVPPSVRDAVVERTSRLGAEAKAALQAAAVLADPVTESALRTVSGLGEQALAEGLTATLAAGLLAEDGRDQVCFRHSLVCRAVYEAIPAIQRRRLHLQAARMLEAAVPQPLPVLAHHFREAGHTTQWCRYAEQAAELALLAGDQRTTAALLHDLVTDADLPAGVVARLAQRIPLAALTGFPSLGDLTHSLRSLLDSDALSSAERAEVGLQLGRLMLSAGDHEAGAAELEAALPGLAHRPAEAAWAMIMLGWPTHTLWPAEVHRMWLDRGWAAAQDTSIPEGDRVLLAVNRATALLLLGEEAGWAAAAELLGDAANTRYSLQVARGFMNTGELAMQWGRLEDARHRINAALQAADRHDYPRLRDTTLATLARLDWFTGAWNGLAQRAETLADLEEPLDRLAAVLVSGLLDMAAGGYQSAEEKLRLVLGEELGPVGMRSERAAALARLRLADGCPGDALELTEEPLRVITAKGSWLWATDVVPVRMQALAASGRNAEAAKLVAAFTRGLRGCTAPAPHAAMEICRAILAESRGQPGVAAGLFARAAADWEALPRPYDALLARERQAHCLIAAGQPEAGLSELHEVFAGLSALPARGDALRVMLTLREHGIKVKRPWWGGRRSYGDQLSPRETDVVRLVVAGRTNREIAGALFLSPKTVSRHVDSAMRKLNVTSRTALAVRVVETGSLGDIRPAAGAR